MPRSVRAAVLHAPNRRFQIETLELADPCAGEVLVRMEACGVCHSDWHVATGDTKHPMPCVAGHEGAGIVEALGSGVEGLHVGDRVALSWAPDCGKCFYCLRGKPNLCDAYVGPLWQGVMFDGAPRLSLGGKPVYHYCGLAAFAEAVVAPAVCCVRVPHDVPARAAALVGCAAATGVGAVLYTAGVKAGDSVAVFGCGGVGLNILQGARLAGAGRTVAIDANREKGPICFQFGATDFLPAEQDVGAAIRRLTDGRGVDWAFEAVGIPAVQESALRVVRPGGALVLVGLAPMGTSTNFPSAELARQEKRILGCYYGSVHPRRDFPMLVELYRFGKLKLDQMIAREYPLEQINEAYAGLLSGESGRGVIVFG
jgi:Zn-dependent alcohol dehydrogenase